MFIKPISVIKKKKKEVALVGFYRIALIQLPKPEPLSTSVKVLSYNN